MQTIKASEFKAKCLRLIDEASLGEEVVITKNGKPKARLVPFEERPKKRSLEEIQAFWKGKIEIVGDIVSAPPPEWYKRDWDDSHLFEP